jgi:16S rRNA processing protein RimM
MADEYHSPPEDYILLGKVSKPQGLRGELRITCFSGQPENVANYKKLYFVSSRGDISRGLSIRAFRVQKKTAIVQLEEITSRGMAEELLNAPVLVAKAEIPEPEGNAFYYFQLEGKQVVARNGDRIGRVKHIFNNGAQDVLVTGSGEQEILIPITESTLIGETDTELIVEVVPGLLDLYKLSS